MKYPQVTKYPFPSSSLHSSDTSFTVNSESETYDTQTNEFLDK